MTDTLTLHWPRSSRDLAYHSQARYTAADGSRVWPSGPAAHDDIRVRRGGLVETHIPGRSTDPAVLEYQAAAAIANQGVMCAVWGCGMAWGHDGEHGEAWRTDPAWGWES